MTLVDAQALTNFLATVPGSFGQHVARNMAVNMLAAGRTDAAVALVDLVGLDVIPALVAAGAPAPALRAAIENAVQYPYRELPEFIARNGGRLAFTAWCRAAEFTAPEGLAEIVDLYRGTMGCSPAQAAAGLHWSLRFDDAAYYATRFADADLTGVVVVHARVPSSGIAAFISGTAHEEVVPAEAPASYEIITDKDRIGDAAVRNAHRLQALQHEGGWSWTETHGTAERVASAARARMTAAGVPRGQALLDHCS